MTASILQCSGASVMGSRHKKNEDSWFGDADAGLLAIADGVSGRPSADIASAMAIERMIETIRSGLSIGQPPPEALTCAVMNSHEALRRAGEEDLACCGMSTTILACVIRGGVAHIAHVGDSRAYVLSDETERCLTRDHSLAATLLEQGRINTETATQHPRGSMLVNCIGGDFQPEVDLATSAVQRGDVILLCTDGLWRAFQPGGLARIARTVGSPRDLAAELVEQAAQVDSGDDVTAVVGRVE